MAHTKTVARRLDPVERRHQIAAAAANLLGTLGPADVTFDDVAHEAGVSRSLVYKYFHDRAALFAAAYEHTLEHLDAAVDHEVQNLVTGPDRIPAVVRAHVDFGSSQPTAIRAVASLSQHPARAVQTITSRRARDLAAHLGLDGNDVLPRALVALLEATAAAPVPDDAEAREHLIDLVVRFLRGGLVATDRRTPVGASAP